MLAKKKAGAGGRPAKRIIDFGSAYQLALRSSRGNSSNFRPRLRRVPLRPANRSARLRWGS